MREVDESAGPVMSMPNAQKPGILAMAVAPRERKISRDQMQVAVTAFLVLFCGAYGYLVGEGARSRPPQWK